MLDNNLMTYVLSNILDDYMNFIHSEIRIEGLETLDYLDNLCQKERFTEQGDAITFESEVYFNTSYIISKFCGYR